MKKYLIAIALLFISIVIIAQDAPSGYTNYFGLRMWDEGNHPGADSVNQNLIDIDNIMHVRDQRIDSAKSAISWMFNYPGGTFKRYDSTEFDNDTLKVKSGVFPKLSTANTFTNVNNFSNLRTDFGNGTSGVLNFTVANDAGGIFFKKNNSTNVLKWDETDGPYWQVLSGMTVDGDLDITGTYKVNGTPISSGGGDAYLTNRQTFTKRNVFTDTLKTSGIALMDSLKVTGKVSAAEYYGSGYNLTDVAALAKDNYFIGNNTFGGVNDFNGPNTFTDVTNVFVGDGNGLDNLNASGIQTGTLDTGRLSPRVYKSNNLDTSILAQQNQLNYFTKYNSFADSIRVKGMAHLDSMIVSGNISVGTINGIATSNLPKLNANNNFTGSNTFSDASNSYTGNGAGLDGLTATGITSGTLDTARLKSYTPKDSSLFARVGSGISETFNSIVTFAAAVIHSAAETFNGIVTFNSTETHNDIATFNDTVNINAFTKLGENGKLKKEKTIQFPLDTINRTYSRSHGLDWRNITGLDIYVKHDTTSTNYYDKQIFPKSYNGSTLYATGSSLWNDSLTVKYFFSSTSTGLLNDTAFITITYTNKY